MFLGPTGTNHYPGLSLNTVYLACPAERTTLSRAKPGLECGCGAAALPFASLLAARYVAPTLRSEPEPEASFRFGKRQQAAALQRSWHGRPRP